MYGVSFFRALFQWINVGDKYTSSFELDDNRVVNFEVEAVSKTDTPTVGGVFAFDGSKETSWGTKGEYFSDLWNNQRGRFLDVCRLCGDEGPVHAPRYMLARRLFGSEARRATIIHGEQRTVAELCLMLLPYLCKHYFEQHVCAVLRQDDDSSIGMSLPGSVAGVNFIGLQLESPDCGHVLTDQDFIGGHDLLGAVKRVDCMYRASERNNFNRCSMCWPNSVHFLSPELRQAVGGTTPFPQSEAGWLLTSIACLQKKLDELDCTEVTISAISPGYGYNDSWSAPTKVVVTLVPSMAYAQQCAGPVGYTNIVFPCMTWGSSRSLAAMRLVYGSLLRSGTVVFILNSNLPLFLRRPKNFWVDVPRTQSILLNGGHVSLGMTRIVAGRTFAANYPFYDFCRLSHYYGVDELRVTDEDPILLIEDPRDTSLVSNATIDVRGFPATVGTRIGNNIACVDFISGRPSLATALMKLRAGLHIPEYAPLGPPRSFIECGVRDYLAPSRYIERNPEKIGSYGTCFVFVSFGSYGDIVPALAIFKFLCSLGFNGFHVPSLNPEEGVSLLSHLEKGDSLSKFPLYLSALNGVHSISLPVFAPYFFPGVTYPISFEPPERFLKKKDHGIGVLGQIAFESLFGSTKPIRIGSWPTLDSVPRSTDGDSFDVFYSKRGPRKTKALVAYGSSSERFEVPGVQEIKPGDHVSQFKEVEIAYVIGMGTAQTAASCGCRVVALSEKCDRALRTPLDAGRGMIFGLSPKRILPMMALRDLRLLPVIWPKISYFELPHAIALVFSSWWSDILFGWTFAIAYVVRKLWQIVIGPGIPETFLLNIWPSRPSPILILFSSFIISCIRVLLSRAGVSVTDVLWALFLVMRVVAKLPIFYYLLSLDFSFIWSVFLALLLSWLIKYILLILSGCLYPPGDVTVNMQVRFFYVLGFPVVHTRLVNPDHSLVAEGHFSAVVGAFEPYSFVVSSYPVDEPEYWQLELPTRINWIDIERMRPIVGAYSIYHNCQIQMIQAAGYNPLLLGPALWLLVPMIFWMGLSWFVTWVGIFLLAAITHLSFSVNSLFSKRDTKSSVWIFQEKMMVATGITLISRQPLLARAHALFLLVQTAWGREMSDAILFIQTQIYYGPEDYDLVASEVLKYFGIRIDKAISIALLSSRAKDEGIPGQMMLEKFEISRLIRVSEKNYEFLQMASKINSKTYPPFLAFLVSLQELGFKQHHVSAVLSLFEQDYGSFPLHCLFFANLLDFEPQIIFLRKFFFNTSQVGLKDSEAPVLLIPTPW